MWSQLQLCLLVGLAFASKTPGFKENTEYTYNVRLQTLSSLHDLSDEYLGVLLKARLTILSGSATVLQAKIQNVQYAELHTHLDDFKEPIPDSQLNYESLKFTEEPFEIALENGVIRNLIVSQNIENWELNIIKAIVSQFQLDTNGVNMINSDFNDIPVSGENSANFKTMEDTVTGITETLYDIHQLSDHVLQSQPWLAPLRHLKAHGHFIEIVKTKNHSRSLEFLPYHQGFEKMAYPFESLTNQIGDLFYRTTVSRAVVSGTYKNYLIQSTVTDDEIIVSPTLANHQKGSVRNFLNVTLLAIKQQSGQFQVNNPTTVGSLVYSYDHPFEESSKVRPEQGQYQEGEYQQDYGSEYGSEFGGKVGSMYSMMKPHRHLELLHYHHDRLPELREAPKSPLLPYTTGYHGKSIKNYKNVVDLVVMMCKQISVQIKYPNKLLDQYMLSHFVKLVSIIRTMNFKEMSEVSERLYTTEEGEQLLIWKIWRDSVAQAGTGPALLTIQDWIQTGKVYEYEAAQLVHILSRATRQPTEQYMQTFYKMLQNQKIMEQAYLNQSVIFSFTHLCRKVYVDEYTSHDNYPVHVFGDFNTKAGQKFLEKEVIPFFDQKLKEAIRDDFKPLIHVYIYALRNIGHVKILSVFEPYLEGTVRVSQPQRVMMVLALKYIVETKPLIAQRVLYRLYQNPAENDLVRSLAVYLLVHSHPSADLLQRMAQYTNVDTNAQVNAAVQTNIYHAANLKGSQYEELRSAAKSALPYLTSEVYGVQDFKKILYQYVSEELDESYTQSTITFGSKDQFIPSGFLYKYKGEKSGIRHYHLQIDALVSSIDDLFTVWDQQTPEYSQYQHQQQDRNQPWSSERIAKLLNIQLPRNEQLEGMMYLHYPLFMVEKIMSFNNQTIENLPEFVRHLEELFSNGKEFHYNKLMNNHEYTIALPTATGFPFIYTYDSPLIYKFDGSLQFQSTPSMAANNKLNKPEKLEGQLLLRALVSGKVQARFGFVTPFSAKHYSVGYDRNVHFDFPVKIRFQLDAEYNQLSLQMEVLEEAKHPQFKWIHFSTWPYTLKEDLMTLNEKRQPIVSVYEQQKFRTPFGFQSTGIEMIFEGEADELPNFKQMFLSWNQGSDAFFEYFYYWTTNKIQASQYNLFADSHKTATSQIEFVFSYDYKHSSQSEPDYYQKRFGPKQFHELPADVQKRRQDFIRRTTANIESADTYVVDAVFSFKGDNLIKYILTAAFAKSSVDPKSNFEFELLKTDRYNHKPYFIKVSANSHIPNTNGLNMDYAIQFDPTMTTKVHVLFGEDPENASKFDLQFKGTKTEERKQYLRQLPTYQDCKRQEQQGNYQLPVCANMTVQANFLDHLSFRFNYKFDDEYFVNQTYKFYSTLKYFLYPYVDENIFAPVRNNDELNFDVQFSPCLSKFTAFLQTEYGQAGLETLFNDVTLNEWYKQLFIPHPVFHLRSRIAGKALGYDIYRPYCVVDNNALSTFDEYVIPASYYQNWTVMMLYIPTWPTPKYRDASQQFAQQVDNYAVFSRLSPEDPSKKEIKVVVQTPQTNGQYVEILLKPTYNQFQVYVNNAEVKGVSKQSIDMYDGYLQVYGLPNNEVKIQLRGDFYILFDGVRARLVLLHGKFRGSVRGICGAFEERATSLMDPFGCILSNPQSFIKSYTFGASPYSHSKPHDECYRKEQYYVDVITENDVSGKYQKSHGSSSAICTKHQTQYVRSGKQVCFTLRPVPVCKPGCNAKQLVSKTLPVHCVKDNMIAGVWKKQIDNGHSPDFSHKLETAQLPFELPQYCEH